MTPARFASCLKLIRGLEVQVAVNKLELQKLSTEQRSLEVEVAKIARMMGEDRFAEAKVLESLSRRLSQTSKNLKWCKDQIVAGHRKALTYEKSKELLRARIRSHENEKEEEVALDLATNQLSANASRQAAARLKE
jgi:hypothetical protein